MHTSSPACPTPLATRVGSRWALDAWRGTLHARRARCQRLRAAPEGSHESLRRFVAGLCPATRSGVLRVALRTPRGETELTDVSPHPRTPVPLRCAKGGCGRVKFLSRPQETRLRAARLSPTSGSSPLSISLSLLRVSRPTHAPSSYTELSFPPSSSYASFIGGKIIPVGGCADPPTLQDARQGRVSSSG